MKFKSLGAKFLTNKYVLHIVFLIALFNILCYVTLGKVDALILFIILSVIIANFSRNMILVLGIPVVFVNLFLVKESCFSMKRHEGFKSKDSSNNSTSDASNNSSTDASNNSSTDASNNNSSAKQKMMMKKKASQSDSSGNSESFQDNSNSQNNNVKNKPKIDYASTVEEAYDNLNGIIGGDGIGKLTNDTQKLMLQQTQLAEAMKNMGPLIENMGPLLETAQGFLGGGGFNGISAMAKKFSANPA
jgi:hypothetical protein